MCLQRDKHLLHLKRKLSGWRHDQRPRAGGLVLHALDHGDEKREGLARPGWRFDHHVTPVDEGWDGLGLNRNRLVDAECGQSREYVRAYARVSER